MNALLLQICGLAVERKVGDKFRTSQLCLDLFGSISRVYNLVTFIAQVVCTMVCSMVCAQPRLRPFQNPAISRITLFSN